MVRWAPEQCYVNNEYLQSSGYRLNTILANLFAILLLTPNGPSLSDRTIAKLGNSCTHITSYLFCEFSWAFEYCLWSSSFCTHEENSLTVFVYLVHHLAYLLPFEYTGKGSKCLPGSFLPRGVNATAKLSHSCGAMSYLHICARVSQIPPKSNWYSDIQRL